MIGQNKTRLLGVSVLVAMFVAGGLTGAVVQRTAQADSTKPTTTPMQRGGPGIAAPDLKLSEDQQKQVCAIRVRNAEQMKPHDLAVQAAWKEHEPAIRSIMDATKAEMNAVLSPDQRATYDEYRAARTKAFEERQAKEKSAKPDSTKEHRGRPGPFGVTCAGLDDGPHGGDRGGPGGPRPRGGDPSRGGDRGKGPASAKPEPAAKTEHQS